VEDATLLDEIIRAWPALSPERRWLLLQLTRDLQRAPDLDNTTGQEAI
jgi:hypothetical protein